MTSWPTNKMGSQRMAGSTWKASGTCCTFVPNTRAARQPPPKNISTSPIISERSRGCRAHAFFTFLHLSPLAAGLSHMTEHGHEEGVVPAGALDFSPDRGGIGMGAQDIEGEPAQDGEI